ncbi:MAG TPA: GDP-mannose 4,6-dehydratase [Acidimicrobiales bacterium]|nr:GDP-mannose 4,6-dehydratase [Acidimicrobiales bacterium]
MRALVTGANGFVGRHLVELLTVLGEEVIAIDRSTGGADLTDRAAVAHEVAAARPEVIYHLGGASDVGGSWQRPTETFETNANGTLHLLLAARAVGARRVLVVSSADVYGKVEPHELPITEESPLRPTSPYAASKVAADHLGQQAWLGHGLEVLRVRAFNHIGPGQSDRFVVPAIAERIARNELTGGHEVPVGNLTARRDITDVRDVVRAYRMLVESGAPGEVYHVCSGVDVEIADLADRLLSRARHPMHLVSDPARLRPVDLEVLRGSNDKLRAATGWQPEHSLDDTLADVLDEWRTTLARL